MKKRAKELKSLLNAIKGTPVLVVGDLILDRYLWGEVERISQEAPVPIVDVKRSEDRLGGAGNVARTLRNLGATVTISGIVGADTDGVEVLGLFKREGIGCGGVIEDSKRPTTLKTRIMGRGQQMVRFDLEDRRLPDQEARARFAKDVEERISEVKAVIVSDYGKGTISSEVMNVLDAANPSTKLGSGLKPVMVDPHPRNYDLYKNISIAKPNRKEAEAASGISIHDRESAERAAEILIKRWNAEMIVLSLSEDGLLILSKDESKPIVIPTVAQEVFDVSGAGDAVVAIFTASLAAGADPKLAGELANLGAGVVVSEIGTVPVNISKLEHLIDRYDSL